MIVIIDYNLGNLGSIVNMLQTIGLKCKISSCHHEIESAQKLILPGVGSFDTGIKNLKQNKLINILNREVILNKKPILGICLGMQLMTSSSEEGSLEGLSWLNLKTKSFESVKEFSGSLPLMGWNYVKTTKQNTLIEKKSKNRFYFVHSYHLAANKFQIMEAEINNYKYCAAFQKDNIFGVQFHPEKSHKFGMELLKKFCHE